MLNTNTTVAQNYNKKSVSFGTNLIVGQGVTDRLNKHPEELKKIMDFKNYLATDGKNWNAELTYDTFTSKKEDAEELLRKDAKYYDWEAEQQAQKIIANMKNPQEAAEFIEKLTKDS